jgi:hypothetical protein
MFQLIGAAKYVPCLVVIRRGGLESRNYRTLELTALSHSRISLLRCTAETERRQIFLLKMQELG